MNTVPRRYWRLPLIALGALLVLAFGALGLLQSRQFELLNDSRAYKDDSLVWSLFQFEAEYLKLRLSLEQAAGPSMAVDAEQVEQRYEIFVSRLALIEEEHAAELLKSNPDYQRTLRLARSFVQWADALPLNAALVREHPERLLEAQDRLDALGSAIHELSLTATHHVADDVVLRKNQLREQNRQALGLTLLQCALIAGLAVVVLGQLRRLKRFAVEQRDLARRLQEARDQAEAGRRAKSVFLANMSHELRTPMHGLLGMLALLKDSPLNSDQQGQLQTAGDSARHLLAVLNDILDVSKMDAGGISIHAEPVQLARLLRELEDLSWPQANLKGLELSMQQDGDVPAWVSADPARLRQILLNLLSNAIKYSESGRVTLHLSHQNDALGRDLLSFEIRDTGIGIEAGAQATLFDRTQPGLVDEIGGRPRPFAASGLGLEIARTLARAMDGDIRVDSEPGRGSVFTLEVRLPACEPPAARAPAGTAALPGSPAAPTAPRSLRILVSEDHDSNRAYLEAVLQRLGHRAVFCENGLEALQRLKQQDDDEDFDLVILDLYTPMMDGYQAARAMRALPLPKSAVRIIGLSADALDETARQAREAGMDDFLTKPVSIERLGQALQRQLQGAEAPPPQPGHPPAAGLTVNEQTVAALRSNLPEAMVRKLYATYLLSLQETREALRAAHSRRDKDGLQKASHSIKGAAANLGLTLVSEPAHALEQSTRQALDWPLIERQMAALLEALARSEALCNERGLA